MKSVQMWNDVMGHAQWIGTVLKCIVTKGERSD